MGALALDANTTASGGTAVVGISALQRKHHRHRIMLVWVEWTLAVNTTGAYNTAVGTNALDTNTTASNNTAVGIML